MDDILRWAASVGTKGAGLILAAWVPPLITGWAFVVLRGASMIWIVVGYLTAEYALTAYYFWNDVAMHPSRVRCDQSMLSPPCRLRRWPF